MRRIAISGLVALAVLLGGVAVPAAAMAQPTAAVRPSITARPTAVGLGVSGQPLISCVLTADCLGIDGSSSVGNGGGPSTPTRVERWNGSSWRRLGVALPKGTRSDDLLGVSCKGVKSCLVVGDYYTSTSQSATTHPLALIYNGTSLKPTPTVPLPKGTTDVALISVSCVTSTYCVALGVAGGNSGAFFGPGGPPSIIETWNGAKWTLHTVAAPTGKATSVQASDVSCATVAFCVLTGEAFTSSGSSGSVKLYVASWNGKKLTAMKPAAVGGGDFLLAVGVSCATAWNCAVTGADLGPLTGSSTGTTTAFTEIWNGKTWQLPKVAWPKGDGYSATLGVSCYAAHSCEAVGGDAANAAMSSFDAAAVSFNGGAAGTVQAVSAPSKGYSDAFSSVSCLPWGSCVAIGAIGKTTAKTAPLMTGVWNGKVWKLYPGF